MTSHEERHERIILRRVSLSDDPDIDADLDTIEGFLKDIETYQLKMDRLKDMGYIPDEIEKLIAGGLKLD